MCNLWTQHVFDKYKELEFYTGVQGEEPAENIVYAERNDTITGDSITYSVNDGAIAYQATVRFGNDIGIQFSDEVRPMMYLNSWLSALRQWASSGCVSSLAEAGMSTKENNEVKKMELSKKAMSIKPSTTMAISSRAAEMKAAGVDVVSFGAGEPDFDTPAHIAQAGIAAIQNGQTRYTLRQGHRS